MTTIAIDFGTSNTIVSIVEPDTQTAKTVRFPSISRLFKLVNAETDAMEIAVIPSLVFIQEPNQILLGEQVRSQRLGLAQPHRLFKTFKRDLASTIQPPPRRIDGYSYSTKLVAERFLEAIWHQLKHLQIYPTQVIFTVPVGAFEQYLSWFRELATKLEIDKVTVIDESTAAALGYAVEQPGSLVLVIDFGGGTLDLSLVRTVALNGTEMQAEVVAKSDAFLGGEDIDLWIVEDYLQQIGSSREAVGTVGWQNLLELAERLKIRLSSAESATESWLDEATFMSHKLHLNRVRFEEILETHQLLEQLRQALDEVVAIALGKGIQKSQIEQVLLVGGSCLIPAVQQLIVSYFGRQRVKLDKPFEAVAHGALQLNQLTEVKDYLRHSYALRLWDPYSRAHTYFPLFEQGTSYPCERAEPLILQVASEGQTEIRLDIGEVATVAQAEVSYDAQGRMTSAPLRQQETYRSLEDQQHSICVAHLNPPGQIGVDRIAVQFAVTEQRMLIATVRDLLTNKVLIEQGTVAKL
jgi:molecular chaperone DnaK (HSP70)